MPSPLPLDIFKEPNSLCVCLCVCTRMSECMRVGVHVCVDTCKGQKSSHLFTAIFTEAGSLAEPRASQLGLSSRPERPTPLPTGCNRRKAAFDAGVDGTNIYIQSLSVECPPQCKD